jgi:Filamin/ABP280 repeat
MARSIFFLMIVLLAGAVFSVTTATTTIAAPAFAQESGMVKSTNKGTLDIGLAPTWSDAGQATFTVSFLNPGTESVHQHQDYDVRILKGGQQQVFSAAGQTGQAVLHNVEGTLTIPYTFQENGDYTVQVFLAGTGIPAIPTDEEATFPITVTPEFPAGGILAAVMTASLTIVTVLSQRTKLF